MHVWICVLKQRPYVMAHLVFVTTLWTSLSVEKSSKYEAQQWEELSSQADIADYWGCFINYVVTCGYQHSYQITIVIALYLVIDLNIT